MFHERRNIMSLIPWRGKKNGAEQDLGSPLGYFRSEMDNLLDRFFNDPWDLTGDASRMGNWFPSVDVTETTNEVVVRAEMPGVDPKDLDVTLSGQMLTLSGEKKGSSEKKGENYHHTERYFGTFRRSIQLPSIVDGNQLHAEHKNGVLEVRIRKQPSAIPKRIEVKTASDRN